MESEQAPATATTPTGKAATFDAMRIAKPLNVVCDRMLSRPVAPEPTAADIAAAEERERAARFDEVWKGLTKSFGRRYAGCRLANFDRDGQERERQDAAVSVLTRLAENVRDHVSSGGNVILYGPPGTGKDHLLVAVLRAAVNVGCICEWINGQDLYGQFRDRIDTDTSEDRSVRQFCRCDVLAISDPVPPKGETSGYSATMLYRIVDRRYRELKSTWITVNVAEAEEASRALTGPVFDRLAENCVTVYCNWPSYRRARRPKWMEKRHG